MKFNQNASFLKNGLVLCLLGSMSACQFADEDKMKEKYEKTKILKEHVEVANEELVESFTVEATNELHQFEAVLKFNENKFEVLTVEYVVTSIKKEETGSRGQVETTTIQKTRKQVPIGSMEFRVPMGEFQHINLRIFRNDLEPAIVAYEKNLETLSDLVIRGVVRLTQPIEDNYHRLVFSDDAVMITNGFNLNITADEILSANTAKIITFPDNEKAPKDTNGKSGGKIFIRSIRAKGSLAVIGDGQNGGDGSNGKDRVPFKAAKGADGADAQEDCVPLTQVCTCKRNAKSGENGDPGLPGENGKNAGNGGDSAQIIVTVKEDADFDVLVTASGGIPGDPGVKGKAQLGGDAGGRGVGKPSCHNPGKAGDKGPNGADGVDGKKGSVGFAHKYCVTVGSDQNKCRIKID